jgi:hypothetical protein
MLVAEYLRQPPAWFYARILVGPGQFLTPSFAAHYKITHVVNCAMDEYSPWWFRKRHPTRYRVLNAIDSPQVNILTWYPRFEATLRQFLRESTGVVYVHCQAGMNRSGFLALAYVTRNFGVDLEALVRAARQQRPCVLSNSVFMNQVQEFIYNGRLSNSKDPGLQLDVDSGHIGLPSPGHRAEPAGDEGQTGKPAGGADEPSGADLPVVRPE